MNLAALATRLYSRGFRPGDFTGVKDNELILRAIRPPDITAGIITAPATSKLPGTACLAYEVIAKGFIDTDPESYRRCPSPVAPLDPDVGAAVIVRTAHLEPLQPDLMLHAIKAEHVLAVLPHDSDGYDEAQPEAHIGLVRPEHLADVIPFRSFAPINLPRNDTEAA
jgi:hypothetical protein